MWKRCSNCKGPIDLDATYWVCSVSTCNRKRTALRFCSVSCWDGHLPVARHREAWAEERRAPATAGPAPNPPGAKARPRKRSIAEPAAAASTASPAAAAASDEILIVASRLKDFVRAESGFNTSDRVCGPLSEIVRRVCRQAIENAQRDGRKTILERDIPRG